ncbi:T-cell surface antigen CD2-like isoform X2 [Toxotes jaculatrix]|uniref:T-cell surface antigen CD2-like isoform X2 n=1 Tax=Toxotes jaculatrix TaxID=941984 RepID=UPI001B3A8768|nr:T-cell surface antigen CD2-like isoform X2 [Toxotes jaculatrix]
MDAVVGLFLLLLGVSHGVETSCDGRQNGTQCYGALGGTVVLQLMDNASGIFQYQWKHNKTHILIWKENKLVYNQIENRSIFTPSNGTFRINNLSRTDSGEYKLEIHDSAGRISEQRTLQLSIQAPVSSVRLVSECLSPGKIRVSCSPEGGDSPQYSWTLNGHTLTDAELLSGNNETNSITLKPNISGRLNCSVRNHVSSVSSAEEISTCDHSLLICGFLSAVAVLSLVGIGIFFYLKKKKHEKAEMSATARRREYSENTFQMVEVRSSSDH